MKRHSLGTAAVFLGLLAGCGSTPNSTNRLAHEDTKAEISRLEQLEVRAVVARDAATLERLWGMQYVVNNPNNQIILAKPDPLDRPVLRQSRISFDREIEHITVLDDLAISMGSETVVPGADSLSSGKTVRRRYTNIWKKLDGQWKLVARHANEICER